MNNQHQDPKLRKANLRVAIILGGFAVVSLLMAGLSVLRMLTAGA